MCQTEVFHIGFDLRTGKRGFGAFHRNTDVIKLRPVLTADVVYKGPCTVIPASPGASLFHCVSSRIYGKQAFSLLQALDFGSDPQIDVSGADEGCLGGCAPGAF